MLLFHRSLAVSCKYDPGLYIVYIPPYIVPYTLQNSTAQLPVEELDRIQEYLQTSGLAQR